MPRYTAILAAVLMLAPLGARGADLRVWWEQGFNHEEDAAVRETIAAFEQDSGKQVELVFYPQADLTDKILAAFAAGEPPDFAFGMWIADYIGQWAFDDRLVDLSDAVGSFTNLFDPDVLSWALLFNASTGQKALYGLPVGRSSYHVHVWKSLLERAGLSLADVPKDWNAFWSFWCDEVQPAVRRATGREDVWGIGLPMSVAPDTQVAFYQFLAADGADYVTRDGRLVIDTPEIRQKLVKAIDSYTASYRKGCTPPDSVNWSNRDNNEQFLAQTVVMTPNETLSIPNALKTERPEDYYQNTATIAWPLGPHGAAFPIFGSVYSAVVFKNGSNVALAKEFVRFLLAEGWLAHYIDFSGGRFLPSISKLLEQPFWLDPSDPHLMASVMQVSSRPLAHDYAQASGNWRYDRLWQELPWAKAIHRVVTEGISPEQAVDEATLRIKQMLSE